ncbi:hypothetical protein MRX96_041497 [Rhipicephalus microplus]
MPFPWKVGGPEFGIPFTSFEEMGLWNNLLQTLRCAKYVKPTPVQKYAVEIALAGRHLIACALTGSGKTVLFMLLIMSALAAE